MAIKISELPDAAPLTSGNFFAVSQGPDTFKATAGQVVDAVAAAAAAQVVSGSRYTALPATTSTITFSDTTGLLPGQPLAVTQTSESIRKSYIIESVTTDTQITVSGPPLALGDAIAEIALLPTSSLVQIDMVIPAQYEFSGDTNTLIARETKSKVTWLLPLARLVKLRATHNTPSTGTQPFINASIDGNNVFSDNASDGAQMSGVSLTWVSAGLGTASLANYTAVHGSDIEITLKSGSVKDSQDLTVTLLFLKV